MRIKYPTKFSGWVSLFKMVKQQIDPMPVPNAFSLFMTENNITLAADAAAVAAADAAHEADVATLHQHLADVLAGVGAVVADDDELGIVRQRGGVGGEIALTLGGIEQAEALEQLRALWHGHRIAVHVTSDAPGPGVDTPEDLARVRALFAAS